MSTPAGAPSGAEEIDGQFVIDGLPIADRVVGIGGQVTLKPALHDECQLGSMLRLTIDVEVVSRTDRKKRSEMGDDEAHRSYGVMIVATRKAEIRPVEEPKLDPVDGEEPEEPKPEKASRSSRRRRAEALKAVPDAEPAAKGSAE